MLASSRIPEPTRGRALYRARLLVCICLSTANSALAQPAKVPEGRRMPSGGDTRKAALPAKEPAAKIGKIYVTGNDVTQDRVILNAMGLFPGQTLRYPEVKAAERKLGELGIFDTNPDYAPTIAVLESKDGFGVYKDILVRVTETPTGRMSIMPAITRNGFAISLMVDERNFDLFRIPTSLADIWDGRAFRGAGQKLQMNLVEITVLPCPLPNIAALERFNALRFVTESFVDAYPELLTDTLDGLEKLLEDLSALRKSFRAKE